jgi:hypothetical protein
MTEINSDQVLAVYRQYAHTLIDTGDRDTVWTMIVVALGRGHLTAGGRRCGNPECSRIIPYRRNGRKVSKATVFCSASCCQYYRRAEMAASRQFAKFGST